MNTYALCTKYNIQIYACELTPKEKKIDFSEIKKKSCENKLINELKS